jgi:hypothetical protein
VVVLDKPYKFEKMHVKTNTDIFGITGRKETWVTLRLSLRAYVLLREEFPLAQPYLEKEETEETKTYLFNGPVLNFKGVGRFVMGLADEVTILSPDEFKHYVREKIKSQKLI